MCELLANRFGNNLGAELLCRPGYGNGGGAGRKTTAGSSEGASSRSKLKVRSHTLRIPMRGQAHFGSCQASTASTRHSRGSTTSLPISGSHRTLAPGVEHGSETRDTSQQQVHQ